MNWIVIDTVIQPSCGISFSAIWCKIKLIAWYQSDIFLPPGGIFTPTQTGVILNNKEFPVTIYNVAPFNKNFWSLIKSSQECPVNSDNKTNKCLNNYCILEICPYGLKQHSP
ncbi:anti-adapter protein IraM [Escherichia coli]